MQRRNSGNGRFDWGKKKQEVLKKRGGSQVSNERISGKKETRGEKGLGLDCLAWGRGGEGHKKKIVNQPSTGSGTDIERSCPPRSDGNQEEGEWRVSVGDENNHAQCKS